MKEPYAEGPATHGDLESYVGSREGVGEALTGARAGWALSRDKRVRGADAVLSGGRQHHHAREGERVASPARSETPGMFGNSMRENREIHWLPVNGTTGRIGKAQAVRR